jgi:phosphonate transport system ATP-binding protein
MILINSLIKEYPNGTKALRGIDLKIASGQFTAVLGQSGAGKSTLLRCINGLVKPTSGKVFVDGVQVEERKASEHVRKNVGMIFQQFNLVKRLTVLENVLCGRLAYNNVFTSCLKLFPKTDIEFAHECLNRVGLAEKAYSRADQLSGGQQQRVGIARALAQRPRVILADEPVASLDPKSADKIMDILCAINQQDGITVVASLHNIELAGRYAQRVIGIRGGRVVLDKPAHQFGEHDVDAIYDHQITDELDFAVMGGIETWEKKAVSL